MTAPDSQAAAPEAASGAGWTERAVPAAPAGAAALLQLLRPRQWVKNAFVLAPLVFAAAFTAGPAVAAALAATALFCVASSATYVLNDLRDAPADRLHPTKRHSRPIAAGTVSPTQAKALAAALYATLALGALGLPPAAAAGLAAYVAINVAYTLRLKAVPVVDLFCIAAGFVLRVWVGAAAIGVPLSSWMATTTLCLALYLAAIKRRQELAGTAAATRAVLSQYTPALLDRYAQMAGMGAMVFYALFTMTVRPALGATVPVVLFGLFRYAYLVERYEVGESPTDVLWADGPLAATIAVWGGLSLYLLWPAP